MKKETNMAKDKQPIGMAHSALTIETTVTGNISAATDIRIDGTLQGNLDCQGKVIIGEQGRVQGNISAINAEIMGTVCGDISVAETLVLKSSSFLEGNITVSTLIIEPNAHLNGQCSMQTYQK